MKDSDTLFIQQVLGAKYSIGNTNGFNCWGLVAYYYAQKGVLIPDYTIGSLDVREISAVFTKAFIDGTHGFIKTDKPNDGDVIIYKSKVQMHCGLLFGGKLLHSSPAVGGVVYQNKKIMGFPIMEYWTHDN